MIVRSTNQQWSQMELYILRACYEAEEPVDQIMVKLPDRSREAIISKALDKGFKKKKQQPMNTNAFSNTKSIERLEAELNLAKAKAEYEAAQQHYTLFCEQCKVAFVQALKVNETLTIAELFKQNAKEFSKLNGAITNSGRKMLEAKINLDLVA